MRYFSESMLYVENRLAKRLKEPGDIALLKMVMCMQEGELDDLLEYGMIGSDNDFDIQIDKYIRWYAGQMRTIELAPEEITRHRKFREGLLDDSGIKKTLHDIETGNIPRTLPEILADDEEEANNEKY